MAKFLEKIVGYKARDVLFKFYVENKISIKDVPKEKLYEFLETASEMEFGILSYYETMDARFEPDNDGNLFEILIFCKNANFKVRSMEDKKYGEIFNSFAPWFVTYLEHLKIQVTIDFKIDLTPELLEE